MNVHAVRTVGLVEHVCSSSVPRAPLLWALDRVTASGLSFVLWSGLQCSQTATPITVLPLSHSGRTDDQQVGPVAARWTPNHWAVFPIPPPIVCNLTLMRTIGSPVNIQINMEKALERGHGGRKLT